MNRELPKGWEWKRLGEVAAIGAGNGAPQGDNYFIDGKYPFVRTRDVGREKAISCLTDTTDKVNNLAVKNFNLTLWPEKALLIPKSGASTFLNHRALLGLPAYVSSHLATVVAGDKLLPDYLYYWSLTIDAKHLTHDINYPSLRLSELESAKIPLPPLSTQRKIVSILEKAEETKKLRKQADELTTQFLQSVFYEMLGDPFKNSKKWPIKEIGNICKVTKLAGFEYSKYIKYSDKGEIIMIRGLNVKNCKLRLDDIKYINKNTSDLLIRSKLNKGDVVITYIGINIGDVALVPESGRFHLAPNVAKITPIDDTVLNPVYLVRFLALKQNKLQFNKYTSNTAKQALNMGNIRKLTIPLPPLLLQQKFARIVEKVEAMREKQKESKQEIENLFNALMQKAFTGELVA